MTTLDSKNLEIATRSPGGPYPAPKDEIIQFGKHYDPDPRHIDKEAAARSIFGGLTASSAHTFSGRKFSKDQCKAENWFARGLRFVHGCRDAEMDESHKFGRHQGRLIPNCSDLQNCWRICR